MLAPILVHTTEEAFKIQNSKFKTKNSVESVHLAKMPKVDDSIDWQSQEQRWEKIMGLRDEVLKVLEGLRQEQKIGSNQQACATIYCEDKELAATLNEFGLEQFAALCIVSEVKLQKGTPACIGTGSEAAATVVAQQSSFKKCQRCWNYWPSVGADSEYPDLCKRCVEVVRNL